MDKILMISWDGTRSCMQVDLAKYFPAFGLAGARRLLREIWRTEWDDAVRESKREQILYAVTDNLIVQEALVEAIRQELDDATSSTKRKRLQIEQRQAERDIKKLRQIREEVEAYGRQ